MVYYIIVRISNIQVIDLFNGSPEVLVSPPHSLGTSSDGSDAEDILGISIQVEQIVVEI